jgi:hypothetical protein
MLIGYLAGLFLVNLIYLALGVSLISAIVILSISKLLNILLSVNLVTLYSIFLKNSLEVIGIT